jgi:hypothetical protein
LRRLLIGPSESKSLLSALPGMGHHGLYPDSITSSSNSYTLLFELFDLRGGGLLFFFIVRTEDPGSTCIDTQSLQTPASHVETTYYIKEGHSSMCYLIILSSPCQTQHHPSQDSLQSSLDRTPAYDALSKPATSLNGTNTFQHHNI